MLSWRCLFLIGSFTALSRGFHGAMYHGNVIVFYGAFMDLSWSFIGSFIEVQRPACAFMVISR